MPISVKSGLIVLEMTVLASSTQECPPGSDSMACWSKNRNSRIREISSIYRSAFQESTFSFGRWMPSSSPYSLTRRGTGSWAGEGTLHLWSAKTNSIPIPTAAPTEAIEARSVFFWKKEEMSSFIVIVVTLVPLLALSRKTSRKSPIGLVQPRKAWEWRGGSERLATHKDPSLHTLYIYICLHPIKDVHSSFAFFFEVFDTKERA